MNFATTITGVTGPSSFTGPSRFTGHALAWLIVATLFLGAVGPAAAVPKTDTVVLHNGDTITGEIKGLDYGKLSVSTDDMGTVSIKWDKVRRITSRYWFLVTRDDGRVHFGQLPASDEDGFVVVSSETASSSVPMAAIISLEPIRVDAWDRYKISVSAGFNWTKASQTSQANVALSADYRGLLYDYGLAYSLATTTERDDRTTRRSDLDFYGSRKLSGRLQAGLSSGLQRNDQLGLALRTSLGANMGYLLIMGRNLELAAEAGAAGNREWPTLDDPPSYSAEATLSLKFTFFRYDSPKSNVTVKADLYPSLTVADRVRFEFNTALRHELVSDLFVELQYYESRDNRPPNGAEATSDRGIVFSLGWTH